MREKGKQYPTKLWQKMVGQDGILLDTLKFTGRWYVEVRCPSCGVVRSLRTDSVLKHIGKQAWTGLCRKCAPRERGLRQRAMPPMYPPHPLVDWTTVEWRPSVDKTRPNREKPVVQVICPGCQEIGWVSVGSVLNRLRHSTFTGRCQKCRVNRGTWAGGRLYNSDGYINRHLRTIPEEHQDLVKSMVTMPGYVSEHRYIMAVKLGRPLLSSEIVHHINGIRDDNHPGNLAVQTRGQHSRSHFALFRENLVLRRLIKEKLGMTDEEIDKEVKDER